tara:strand:+ start:525 stop:1589 length:1065 start_codon:yes stop_codon:yes gene_type:complete
MLNSLDNLSLIIPSHERKELLNRSIDFWSAAGVKNIIVLDSSEKINKYVSNKVKTYIHLPNVGFIDKFKFSIDNIKTDYVLVCADDDYVSTESIIECIKFLNNNLSFVAAHGHYCDFRYVGKSNSIRWQPKYSYVSPSLEFEDPIDRLGIHLNYYTPILYSVIKKETFVNSYAELAIYKKNIQIEYTPFYEIFWSSMQVLKGKVKRIDSLYSLRRYMPNSAGNYYLQYYEIYLNDNFYNCYSLYKKFIENNYSQGGRKNQRHKDIDFYFNNFFRARLNVSKKHYFPVKNNNVNKSNENYKSLKLYYIIKRYFLFIKTIYLSFKVQNNLNIHVPKLWWFKIYKHHSDIKNISKFL